MSAARLSAAAPQRTPIRSKRVAQGLRGLPAKKRFRARGPRPRRVSEQKACQGVELLARAVEQLASLIEVGLNGACQKIMHAVPRRLTGPPKNLDPITRP